MGDYRDDIIETGSINLVKGWESGERPSTDSIRCHFSNYEAVNGWASHVFVWRICSLEEQIYVLGTSQGPQDHLM